MKAIHRRAALRVLAGAGLALAPGLSRAAGALEEPPLRPGRMGIVIYALGLHQKNGWAGRHRGLSPALAFLEECHALGAGGIQCPVGTEDAPHAAELRGRAERYGMYVEAVVSPPRDDRDVERFERDVKGAKEAGASLARTVIFPGRRYEEFHSLAAFREAERRGRESLERAEPVLARQRFRLAVENHKDQLVAEKLALLERLCSEWVGLCVDVGNNIALLEDPLETVRSLAPWALTVHIKDAVLGEYDDGLLLGDAALGEGILELPVIVRTLREAKPAARFNLETITRDALRVPVKTEGYWAVFDEAHRRASGPILRRFHDKVRGDNLSTVTQWPAGRQLDLEQRNVEQSLKFAREHLAL
jgi:sugar phosphate isomerase/epimerase